jgi:hypothetical protein
MQDDRIERRYCVVIQLKDGRMEHLRECLPLLLDMIKRWSNGDFEQLLRSSDGTLSAFLVKTKKPAGMLSAEFESNPGTRFADTFIAFEIGKDCSSSNGFQRALAWIQHR